MRGLRLGQLSFGRGETPFRLGDTTLGRAARLIHAGRALPKLVVEHGDLVPGQAEAGLRLAEGARRLQLTGADLLGVEHRDDLTGRDPVAFPHGDVEDAPGGLGGHGGALPLDPSAHRDHAARDLGPRDQETPGDEADKTEDGQRRDERQRAPARDHGLIIAHGSRTKTSPR